MRRRRRARRNPTPNVANVVLTWGGIAGVASAVLGAPQLGGALMLGSGTYSIIEGKASQKVLGGLYDLIGLGMVLVGRR
jgi:hypothetical protein